MIKTITQKDFEKLIRLIKNAKVFKQKPFKNSRMSEITDTPHGKECEFTLYYSEGEGNWVSTIKIRYSTELMTYIVIEFEGLLATIHEINKKEIIGMILDAITQNISMRISVNEIKIRENILYKRLIKKYSKKWRTQWKT